MPADEPTATATDTDPATDERSWIVQWTTDEADDPVLNTMNVLADWHGRQWAAKRSTEFGEATVHRPDNSLFATYRFGALVEVEVEDEVLGV